MVWFHKILELIFHKQPWFPKIIYEKHWENYLNWQLSENNFSTSFSLTNLSIDYGEKYELVHSFKEEIFKLIEFWQAVWMHGVQSPKVRYWKTSS